MTIDSSGSRLAARIQGLPPGDGDPVQVEGIVDLGAPADTESADGAHLALGATTDAEAAGDGSLIAITKRLRTLLGNLATALAGTLTVAGTVTADAGTDLNTSALALEAGGNLAAAATSLATLIGHVDGVETALATVIGHIDTLETLLAGTLAVEGGKSNDAAAPGTDNLGTLPAVATAADPAYTEGNQVGLSVALDGRLRVETAPGGGGGAITDIEDGAGDSIMDATLNAAQVSVVNQPTVTADAGTNLNTSLLALETGGNLAAAVAALATLIGHVDGVEAALATVIGHIDTLETLLGGTLAVAGTVTANAGTDLNTSLLALETGGNLAAAVASLATIIGHVDGLEGFVDGVEASLTTIIGHIDGIETLLAGTLRTAPAGKAATDRSDTLTTGGTAETLMASNASRTSWRIENPNATEVLWYSLVGTAAANAAGSAPLYPGGAAWSADVCETNAISWVAATTGAKVTARETS